MFYLPMSTKGCSGFFLFRLDLELIRKLVSVSVQKPGHFQFLQITQDLNKIKEKSKHPFVDIDK